MPGFVIPVSVAKFIRPRSFNAVTTSRTLAVHKFADMHAIGAQIFFVSF